MKINRDKHNKYVVNWTPTYPTSTTDTSTGQTGSSTIIYVGGGSGTGGGTTTPTVEQEAFAYYSISDGTNTIVQAASIPRDTAYLTIIGDDNINVTAVTESSIPEQEFVSTGTNTGTYTISYQKVVTIPEAPTEPEETEEPTEPVIPEPVTTYPLNIVYVSGDKIQTTQFDALRLYNVTVENEVETKTEIKSIALAELTIEGDTNGIQSITADVGNISFNRVEFTITTSTEVEGEQVTQTTAVLSFDVQILNKNTVYVKSNFDIEQYWKLDENGNLYTDYNAYSTKELSAYGLGSSEENPEGGAQYLYQLQDVDKETAQTPADKGILQYNATKKLWEVTDGSDIKPDLTGYATTEWVTTQVNNYINQLKGSAPEDMDTLGEIAGVISNVQEKLTSLEVLLEWFEWDDANDAIKALFDLYGVGEISAYGYNTQEQPVGAQYLNDLLDVTVSNPTNNQILIYNGSQWVNQVLPESGLNESELAQYLTEHNYVQSSALKQYATITQLNQEITNLIGGAPAELDTLGEIATVIQSLQQLLDWFSFVDGKIRANYDLWGVGEISAYGVGEGSSSSGKNYLHELEDVSITPSSLTSGQLLQYNGSVWVAIDKDEVGLNETELASYLTRNNYLQEGDVTWSNLPGKPTTFDTTIAQITNLPDQWETLLTNSPTAYVTRWPQFSEVTNKPTTLEGYGITDAFTKNQADDRYVNVTGDTMTGNLTLPALIANDYVRIGSTARLEYDSANNAIKVTNASGGTVNFYATGEVSAYGAGSGSTIRGYLNDLQDVTINGATTGQALIYNGSQWVNQTIQQGLDEDALEDYLNSNGYLPSDAAVNQGTAGKLAYYSGASTIDDYISTVGSNTKFMYLNAGVPTASNGTVGSTLTPIYLNAGTFTTSDRYRVRGLSGVYTGNGGIEYPSYFTDYGLAVNMMDLPVQHSDVIYINGYNNGGADVPYINAIAFQKTANAHGEVYHARGNYNGNSWGTWYKFVDSYNYTSIITKLGTSTVGGPTKLWYLNAGTPTNSTSTVGSNYVPVFLSSGTITASSQEFMVNRGVLSDYWTNWNSALTAGMYSLAGWGTNGPTNASYEYGTVAIFQSGSSSYGGAVSQLYMPHADNGAGVYAAWRTTYQESSSRWTNWHYLLDTGNAQSFLGNYYVKKSGDVMTGSLRSTYFEVSNSSAGYRLLNSSGSVVSRLLHDGQKLWLQTTSSGYISITGIGDTQLNNIELQANTVNIPSGIFQVKNSAGYGSLIEVTAGTSSGNSAMLTYKNTGGTLGYLGVSASSTFSGTNKTFPMFGTSSSNNYMIYTNRDHVCFFLKEVDLTSYSTSNFYPFVFNLSRGYREDIEVMINSEGGSGGIAYNTNKLHFIARNGGWSDNGTYLYIINHFMYQDNELTISAIGRGTQNGTFAVWLRGGKRYSVYHTAAYDCDIHTASYSIQGATYTVGRNATGGTNTNVAVWWTPVTGAAANRMEFIGTFAVFRQLLTATDGISCTGNITATGNVVAQGEITAYSSSDIRFKTDIHNLTGLDYIRKMRPVEYDWTDEALELKANKVRHGYGLIAQELEQIIPDLVTHNMFNEGYLGIDYTRLVPFTISAIQEVDDEVTKLKKRVKELENKINKYEKLNRQRTARVNISDATICS